MKVIELSEKDFFEKIENSEGKVLVDCYAPWCGPCKMLSPIIDELAEEIDNCTFYKVNVDDAEELSVKYGIMSIPTILLFDNKELKEKIVGLKTKEELKTIINN